MSSLTATPGSGYRARHLGSFAEGQPPYHFERQTRFFSGIGCKAGGQATYGSTPTGKGQLSQGRATELQV